MKMVHVPFFQDAGPAIQGKVISELVQPTDFSRRFLNWAIDTGNVFPEERLALQGDRPGTERSHTAEKD
jgi:hypothetical protein